MRLRGLATGLAAAAMLVGGLVMATPAQAVGTLMDNGNGTVTVTYSGVAELYVLRLCPQGTVPADCSNGAGQLYALSSGFWGNGMLPPSPALVSAGMLAYDTSLFDFAPIQPGTYTLLYEESTPGWVNQVGLVDVRIGYPPAGTAAPTPDWVQGYARPSAAAACDEGWNPSWEFWANGGTGGFVCTRSVPMYG
jgi:hypothetical protein